MAPIAVVVAVLLVLIVGVFFVFPVWFAMHAHIGR